MHSSQQLFFALRTSRALVGLLLTALITARCHTAFVPGPKQAPCLGGRGRLFQLSCDEPAATLTTAVVIRAQSSQNQDPDVTCAHATEAKGPEAPELLDTYSATLKSKVYIHASLPQHKHALATPPIAG